MLWKAPLFLSTPPSALATRFCKPLSNLHPTSTLPPAARSTACLSIYLHIFVIFRDVNPWAFLSHLFPFPTPLLQRARIKCENSPPAIFSLSLFFSPPLPPMKLYCQIRARLRLPLTHSAIFSRWFFFPSSVLGCRCYCTRSLHQVVLFFFRNVTWMRSTQGEYARSNDSTRVFFW